MKSGPDPASNSTTLSPSRQSARLQSGIRLSASARPNPASTASPSAGGMSPSRKAFGSTRCPSLSVSSVPVPTVSVALAQAIRGSTAPPIRAIAPDITVLRVSFMIVLPYSYP